MTSRKRAWEDCEALLEKHAGALQEASSQVLSDDAFALEEESDDGDVSLEDEDDPPIKGEASFVVSHRVPFGQKYVEGSAVEEGEVRGPARNSRFIRVVPSLDPGRLLLVIRCASKQVKVLAHYELLVTKQSASHQIGRLSRGGL